jgi:hypothetical protein
MKQLFNRVMGVLGASSSKPKASYTVEVFGATYVVYIINVKGEPRYVHHPPYPETWTGYDYTLQAMVGDYSGSIFSPGTPTPSNDELVAFVKKVYPAKELIKNGKEGLIARASSLPPPTKDIVLAMFSSLGSGRFSAYDHTESNTRLRGIHKIEWTLKDRLLRVWYIVTTSAGSRALNPTLEVKSIRGEKGTINLTNEEMDYIEKLLEWFEFYAFELRGLQAKRKERKEQRASNALRKQLTSLYRAEGLIGEQ